MEDITFSSIPKKTQNLEFCQSQHSRFDPLEAAPIQMERSDGEGVKDGDADTGKNQVLRFFGYNSFLPFTEKNFECTVTNDPNDEYEYYGNYLQGKLEPRFDHDPNSPVAKLRSRATFVGQIWHQAGKGPIVWVIIKVAFVALASLFAGYFWTAPYREMLNPSKDIVELFAYFREHEIDPQLLLNPEGHNTLRNQLTTIALNEAKQQGLSQEEAFEKVYMGNVVDKTVNTFTKWQSELFSVLGDMKLEEKHEVIKLALEKAMGEAIGFKRFEDYVRTTNALIEPFIAELENQLKEFVILEQKSEENAPFRYGTHFIF